MKITKESLSNLADEILEGVDYDLFKEDMEERMLLSGIENNIRVCLNLEVTEDE